MSLSEHLAELRSRLLRCLIAVGIGFFAAYAFHEELFELIARPVLVSLRAHGIPGLQALQVTEAITVYLQVSLVAAFVLTAPYLFYQFWAFVAPGLYAHERRLFTLVAGLVSGFFFLGVLFCYAVFLPMVVDYLVGFTQASGSIRLLPTVEKTFSIALLFPLVFGVLFQLPLVQFLLALLGIVDHRTFLKFSRYFVVLAFILGAVFTPPDILSQVLMAVPICLLFFVGVAFAWAAGLIREGGNRTVARVVATGVVLVFAALVVTASILWNLPRAEPSPADHVASDARFAVCFAPATNLGKSALEAARIPIADPGAPPAWVLVVGRPGGRDVWTFGGECAGAESPDGVCRVEGADFEETLSLAPRRDLEGAVSALVMSSCVARIGPAGLPATGPIEVRVREEAAPLVQIAVTIPDEAGAWRAFAADLLERWAPDSTPEGLGRTPIGRLIQWSAGDLTVEHADGRTTWSLTLTPGRARRALHELVRGILSGCAEDQHR